MVIARNYYIIQFYRIVLRLFYGYITVKDRESEKEKQAYRVSKFWNETLKLILRSVSTFEKWRKIIHLGGWRTSNNDQICFFFGANNNRDYKWIARQEIWWLLGLLRRVAATNVAHDSARWFPPTVAARSSALNVSQFFNNRPEPTCL